MQSRPTLSKVQRKIYYFIVDFIQNNKYPPTIREIADGLGYKSKNSVVSVLTKLQNSGYIIKNNNSNPQARTIQIIDEIMGYSNIIDTVELSSAIANLREKGINIGASEAVELLTALNIKIN